MHIVCQMGRNKRRKHKDRFILARIYPISKVVRVLAFNKRTQAIQQVEQCCTSHPPAFAMQ